MKIDVSYIVTDHLNTLRDARTRKMSKSDLCIFYAVPALIGALSFWELLGLTKDFYNLSITFFGIFIALFLNLQVAIFGILQRKWEKPGDDKLAEIQAETLNNRRLLLKEMNANISYLILVSCLALVMFLIMFVVDQKIGLAAALSACLYSHFILTLLMIVKRSHALFQREYVGS